MEAENNRGGLINEDFLPLRRKRGPADNARNRTPLSSFVFLFLPSPPWRAISRRYLDFGSASDSAAI